MTTTETTQTLPLLTGELPGTGGVIKTRCEDFVVDEQPACQPSGKGPWVYAHIEKKSMTTPDALSKIARALKVPPGRITYAGMKDARAVTRQWIAIEGTHPDLVSRIEIPRLRILHALRHNQGLTAGQHAANRFVIHIRRLTCPLDRAAARAERIMDVLTRRGVPNYFGCQRFGTRRDAHLLGAAIVHGQFEQFVDFLLGLPDSDADVSHVYLARSYYEQARFQDAHDAWPAHFHQQRRALRAIINSNGDRKHAYNVIDRRTKRFFIAAMQSDLFNKLLGLRMPQLDKLQLGDIACRHKDRSFFPVAQPNRQQSRCAHFQISPTGALVGPAAPVALGPVGRIEQSVLAEAQLSPHELARMSRYHAKGGRRPLRFLPRNTRIAAGHDDLDEYLRIDFELDAGCYATAVLREITKDVTLT